MNDLQTAAKDAIAVQNAVNLSGVLHSWARVASLVADSVGTNHGPKFTRHPLNVLYASKVASLLAYGRMDSLGGVTDTDDKDLFRSAYAWALDTAREPHCPMLVVESVANWARTPELFESTLRGLRYHAGDNFWSFTTAGMFVGIEPDGYMHT